tara:strand:+ start:242 stop:766 length:525 start_codon:yes stop_codon:yes gene_type:complete
MNKNRFKILSVTLSYIFFISVIIISINAVVPEKNLQLLEPKEVLVKKVDNNFSRDKNSVYEILEKDNHESEKSVELKEERTNIKIVKDGIKKNDFRIQFASFREKQKSLQISSQLKEKMSKMSIGINLIVKEVKIKENQTFYRVISELKYPLGKANSECEKLKRNKIQCIIIKS